MKCYYEELGVERSANETDIKMAYRKLALRWHPDKNPDCIEVAKEKFQLIQQAYDVLSDSQERAWYDNHREQILRGKNSNYEENCLNVFEFFTESCYKDYSDDANSFYAIYAEVFNKIACEDVEFMDDDEEITFVPKFGNSTSDYDEVVAPFYAYWQSYCTKKTYTWLCPYDIKEVKERRILREIEKKMKKIVQKARKARNEEVRILVSFVRKRDKRVEAHRKSQEASAALRKAKQEQDRVARMQRRQAEVEKMRHEGGNIFSDAYEEQLKLLEKQYNDDSTDEKGHTDEENSEDDSNNSDKSGSYNSQAIDDEKVETIVGEMEEEPYVVLNSDDFYCVICNKSFKSKRALANHEMCKKHLDKMEEVKEEMLREEKYYQDSLQNTIEDDAYYAEEKELNSAYANTANDHVAEEVHVEKLLGDKTVNSSRKKETKSKKCTNKLNNDMVKQQHNDGDFTADNQSDNESKALKKKLAAKSKNKPAAKQKAPAEDSTKSTCVCVTCGAAFESKNKLFAHLKLTNHSVYVPKKAQPETELTAAKRQPKGKRGH